MTLIRTERRDLGYVEVDHRATDLPPGTPRHFEADTYTCTHCQRVVAMNPKRTRPRSKCKACNHDICDGCGADYFITGACVSMARRIEEYLEREARLPGSGASVFLP